MTNMKYVFSKLFQFYFKFIYCNTNLIASTEIHNLLYLLRKQVSSEYFERKWSRLFWLPILCTCLIRFVALDNISDCSLKDVSIEWLLFQGIEIVWCKKQFHKVKRYTCMFQNYKWVSYSDAWLHKMLL